MFRIMYTVVQPFLLYSDNVVRLVGIRPTLRKQHTGRYEQVLNLYNFRSQTRGSKMRGTRTWSTERFGFGLIIFGLLSLLAAAISYFAGGPWILAAGYWLGSGVTELIIGLLIRVFLSKTMNSTRAISSRNLK